MTSVTGINGAPAPATPQGVDDATAPTNVDTNTVASGHMTDATAASLAQHLQDLRAEMEQLVQQLAQHSADQNTLQDTHAQMQVNMLKHDTLAQHLQQHKDTGRMDFQSMPRPRSSWGMMFRNSFLSGIFGHHRPPNPFGHGMAPHHPVAPLNQPPAPIGSEGVSSNYDMRALTQDIDRANRNMATLQTLSYAVQNSHDGQFIRDNVLRMQNTLQDQAEVLERLKHVQEQGADVSNLVNDMLGQMASTFPQYDPAHEENMLGTEIGDVYELLTELKNGPAAGAPDAAQPAPINFAGLPEVQDANTFLAQLQEDARVIKAAQDNGDTEMAAQILLTLQQKLETQAQTLEAIGQKTDGQPEATQFAQSMRDGVGDMMASLPPELRAQLADAVKRIDEALAMIGDNATTGGASEPGGIASPAAPNVNAQDPLDGIPAAPNTLGLEQQFEIDTKTNIWNEVLAELANRTSLEQEDNDKVPSDADTGVVNTPDVSDRVPLDMDATIAALPEPTWDPSNTELSAEMYKAFLEQRVDQLKSDPVAFQAFINQMNAPQRALQENYIRAMTPPSAANR